ncbi:hypothetical protein ACO0LF_17835 [Undibacterium sp. Di27W]|uniref:hypothetical protein n=1 Tax=Undibacterium sp. Di27W TaxID=3413036 RepID=UPI003BF2B0EB
MHKNTFLIPSFLLSVLLGLSACAQAAPGAAGLTISSIKLKVRDEEERMRRQDKLVMPYLQMEKQEIARLINERIYLGTLESLPPRNYVQEWRETDMDTASIASMDYKLEYQSERLLSMSIAMDGCGAYCELNHLYFNFDLQTGRHLELYDVLQASAKKYLAQQIKVEQTRHYRQQLATLNAQLKKAQKNKTRKAELEDIESRISLNEDCLSQVKTDEHPLQRSVSFLQDKLIVFLGRCSNHAMRALDDVGDIAVNVSFENLRPYMNAYGRALLLNEGVAKADGWQGQVLHGKPGE